MLEVSLEEDANKVLRQERQQMKDGFIEEI